MLDYLTPHEIAEAAAATTAVGGILFWIMRKLRRLHKSVSDIWLFLAGVDTHESLVDRMIKEEFRSRFVMMHARDGIYECDRDGACNYVNSTMTRLEKKKVSMISPVQPDVVILCLSIGV